MNVFERVAIGAGLAVVGVTIVYRYVLTDEQRGSMQEVADTLRNATHDVTDMVSPLVSDGPTHAEEEAATIANRARTASQWEALGY